MKREFVFVSLKKDGFIRPLLVDENRDTNSKKNKRPLYFVFKHENASGIICGMFFPCTNGSQQYGTIRLFHL